MLGGVKRAVDDLPEPGRFIVTGSARGDLETAVWPGTGRLMRIPIHGFTVRELGGRSTAVPFLDRMSAADEIRPAPDTPDVSHAPGSFLWTRVLEDRPDGPPTRSSSVHLP